jgi:UDPglucose 6-dehydrogenase
MQQARQILSDVEYCENAYACAQDADAIVIVTEWEQFRALDIARLKGVMRSPIMVDLRNVYRAEEVVKSGFIYFCIGKGDPATGVDRHDDAARSEPVLAT